MSLARISINRPIMTTMGLLVFLLFGAIAYFTLNLNLQPDVEIPYVTIQTVYPGAGPKEIETLISKRIEDAVSTVSKIERVESYSLDGASIVIIEFKMGKDPDIANQEVKDKVDEIINELPTDAETPIVQKVDLKAFPIVDVILTGNMDPRELYDIADKTLKDRFSQVEGVAKVNISGGQEREIRIVVDNKVAFENSISMPQLIQVLAAQNVNIPGGYFNISNQEFTVRVLGEFQDLETINELQVPTFYGAKKIKQFAEVKDSGKDIRRRAVYYNVKGNFKNENVIKLGIVKSSDGNIVKVADGIKEAIPEIKATLPKGTNIEIINDESTFVRSSVDDTMSNVLLGVVFTSIVLLIFLGNIRSTIIVALSMPISIISTFMLLQMFDLSLNMMTLMGLSVSVGVLVANSVVVLENIFRHKDMGYNTKEASDIGTSEVTVAVLASTLTNLVVFLPLASMSSIVGQFLRELALAATFATIFSLIISFTLTPMLSALIIPDKLKQGKISEMLDKIFKSWDEAYRKTLRVALKNKKRSIAVIGLAFLMFIGSAVFFGSHLGVEFIPTLDDGKIKIEVELPEGYNLDKTASVLTDIENIIKQTPEVKHMVTELGKIGDLNTGTNMARMDVQLLDAKDRDVHISKIISKFVKDLAFIPDAKIIVDYANTGGDGGAPIQFYLMGQDVNKLEEIKNDLIKNVKNVPGLNNLDQSSRAGKPEITVYPDRNKLSDAGITIQELAVSVRAAIEGIESSKYRLRGDEYDITLTFTDESINSKDKVANITIVSNQTGNSYRLSELADVKYTNGFTKIIHRDKYTTISFTGSPAEGFPLGDVTGGLQKRFDKMDLPAGYRIDWGGNVKMMNEMVSDMLFAFGLAIILTYMLLAAMLESFIQPIYILVTVPLAMIGVFIIMFLTNTAFGITALMGVIMLIGIVVNNAILMLDYTNQLLREKGMHAREALIEACPTKLKPILMSTLAIILGMLPMALGIGDAGAEMRTPLGVVSIGGLVASTVLTLYVLPAFYFVFHRDK
ncbi:MAG TPA: efflux RND transporter permease subunit [Melioribacteraceae bacterium]|nr:efflux RND transporter permease subunit [Melioribacteraceae bacterium]